MNCPRREHDNRPGAKFCEECAAPLARARSSDLRMDYTVAGQTARFSSFRGTPDAV